MHRIIGSVVAVATLATLSLGCGNDEDEAPSERARLDIHGTVGSSRIDLENADVPFYRSSVDDSLISFEVLGGERTISVDLAGRFPVGTHVMDDGWDSSIAGASVSYYEGDKEWHADWKKTCDRLGGTGTTGVCQ